MLGGGEMESHTRHPSVTVMWLRRGRWHHHGPYNQDVIGLLGKGDAQSLGLTSYSRALMLILANWASAHGPLSQSIVHRESTEYTGGVETSCWGTPKKQLEGACGALTISPGIVHAARRISSTSPTRLPVCSNGVGHQALLKMEKKRNKY
ncbi:unnamed protein product [Pleuronectes platessa]|uniref:Uncharacterized protein n=1 Tax=Pleuronectes platessa TaxID=8262 RepID=A0A9N7YJ19_PLEPL|nr:unnamed protein product [Pleuronectes platessa]